MTLLAEALRLTKWFEVFPLGPAGKPLPNCDDCARSKGNSCPTVEDMAACKCALCHSFYAASRYPERVKGLWRRAGDDSLIGLRTGRGLVVLDFDKHGAHDGSETFQRWQGEKLIRKTWTARTGGDGLHLYYGIPEGMEIRNGQPQGTVGVDVKGDGGYVVAPPSRKEGADKSYEWLRSPESSILAPIHPELLEAIVSRPERRAPSIKNAVPAEGTSNLFDWFVSTFPMGGGNRNNHLFQAACVAGECIELGVVTEIAAIKRLTVRAEEAGLRPGEIKATLASGINRGRNNILGSRP